MEPSIEQPNKKRTREQSISDLRTKRFVTHEPLGEEERALEIELKSLGNDDQPLYRQH